MYPELYDSSGTLLASLDNIIDDSASIRRVVNGEFTFSFDAYEKDLKSEYFNTGNVILIANQKFDIKKVVLKHDGTVAYNMLCEHVNYRMEDGVENKYATYSFTGTPTDILTNILAGTEFTVGTVEFTDVITVSVNSEITRKSLIYQLANILGGEVDYSNQGFTINVLNTIGQDRGFKIQFGTNLKGLTRIIDSRGELKTYYEVSLIDLKNSTEYISKGYQNLEVVDVGDTIEINDWVVNINVENRVYSITYNPVFEMNISLEIANTINLITDRINLIESTYVQQDKVYNNVSISQEYGFRSELSNKLARATYGGATISMDVGDGLGNYSPAVYFDPSTGKYKYIGDVDVSGTITGAEIIGSIINNGAGTFYVDALGNVVAGSLTMNNGIIDNGLFTVDALGNVVANSLTMNDGIINNGLFTVDALGNVVANSLTMNNGIIDNGLFTVDTLGNVVANSLTMNGGDILSANINISENIAVGDSIYIGNQASPYSKGLYFGGGANIGLLQDGSGDMTLTAYDDLTLSADQISFINAYTLMNSDRFGFTTTGSLGTVNTGDMVIDLASDFALDAVGYIDLISSTGDVLIGADGGDIYLAASNKAYYNGVTADYEIVVMGDISNFITESFADTTYCTNASSQNMAFQVVGGGLEVFAAGVYQFTLTP